MSDNNDLLKNLPGGLKDMFSSNIENMKNVSFTGESPDRKVRITINGLGMMTNIEIDSALFEDSVNVLQDMIMAASNNARVQLEQHMQKNMMNMFSNFGGE